MYTNNSVHIVYPAFETYSIKKTWTIKKGTQFWCLHRDHSCFNNVEVQVLGRKIYDSAPLCVFLSRYAFTAVWVLRSLSLWKMTLSLIRCFPHGIAKSNKNLRALFINFNKIPNTKISPELSQPLHHVIQMAVGTHCFASLLTKSWQQSFHRDHFGWGFSKK